MATAAVVTNIESHANRANGSVEEETGEKLTFNPKDLEARYQAERAKRINNGGIQQYHFISKDTSLANYIEDPYVDPNFSREPVDVECEAVIIGGGYGGLLTAVRLLERGITNIRIIEKGGDFGGTWYATDLVTYCSIMKSLTKKLGTGTVIREHSAILSPIYTCLSWRS